VLILDEPTSGLDPRQIADMRVLIRGMAGRRTVILSTHILPEVQMTCSRVIILDRGRIVASGTPEKLTTRIQNRFQTLARIVGPSGEIQKALSKVTGVQEVNHREPRDAEDGNVRGVDGQAHEYVLISGIDTPDVRPAVAAIVVKHDWKLVELHQIGLTLEDIFLKAVAGEQTASIRGPAAPAGSTVAPAMKSSRQSDRTEAAPAQNPPTASPSADGAEGALSKPDSPAKTETAPQPASTDARVADAPKSIERESAGNND
jgi:ABC-2 type transport system ATP-binding protein